MAMPPRSTRHRAGTPRWMVVPFALTILVLLVDASMHARSPEQQSTINSQAWVDAVLPEIASSSAQGLEIAQVSSGGLSVPAGAVASELASIAASAASTYRSVGAAAAPPQVARAAGLLQACLMAREQGAQQMAAAVGQLVKGGGEKTAVAEMTGAVSFFDVGDTAYELFAKSMPNLGARMPPSQWVAPPASYSPSGLGAFSARLLADMVKMSQEEINIDAISTNPATLSIEGNVDVLSPATTVSVTVVVAAGAQEDGVVVTATIAPAEGAPEQKVSGTVDLSQGQADAITLAGLRTVPSALTTLTVTAVGPGGPYTSATRELRIEVPGPNFSGVATTTVPAAKAGAGGPTTSAVARTTTTEDGAPGPTTTAVATTT